MTSASSQAGSALPRAAFGLVLPPLPRPRPARAPGVRTRASAPGGGAVPVLGPARAAVRRMIRTAPAAEERGCANRVGSQLDVVRVVRTFAGEPTRNFFPLSTLINSSELLRRGQQIVIIGDRDDAETQALVDCLHSRSLPDRILNFVTTPDDLPAGHPAEGK